MLETYETCYLCLPDFFFFSSILLGNLTSENQAQNTGLSERRAGRLGGLEAV